MATESHPKLRGGGLRLRSPFRYIPRICTGNYIETLYRRIFTDELVYFLSFRISKGKRGAHLKLKINLLSRKIKLTFSYVLIRFVGGEESALCVKNDNIVYRKRKRERENRVGVLID